MFKHHPSLKDLSVILALIIAKVFCFFKFIIKFVQISESLKTASGFHKVNLLIKKFISKISML